MKITRIVGKEVYNSRGEPTIMCEIFLNGEFSVNALVPSGASRGSREAFELLDGDKRLGGKGVLKAIQNIETIIAPELLGKEPDTHVADYIMQQLDGTVEKSKLGANAMLAVSMAICKAQALAQNLELFEMIAQLQGAESVSLPFPLFNFFNGGVHSYNNFPLQEILIVPVGLQNFRTAVEASVTVFQHLKILLIKHGKMISVGDEGGFACSFKNEFEPFDFLIHSVQEAGYEGLFTFAIDSAASQLYNPKLQQYEWVGGAHKTKEQIFDFYEELLHRYPLYSIEDGVAEFDIEGWKSLYAKFGNRLQIVGDDLCVTNIKYIEEAVQENLINAVIIKPNQIGTITETLEAVALCHENSLNVVISHRSGDTEDSFIADLAVGVSAGQIKSGGCSRSERMAKYNRLLCIEDMLAHSLMDA